jgi:putative endonuclease
LVAKLTSAKPLIVKQTQWSVYILRCTDGSLYTGITVDTDRRLREHSGELGVGKGAKSLRGKAPLVLVYSLAVESRSVALKLEYRIKQLSKLKKEGLVSGALTLADTV